MSDLPENDSSEQLLTREDLAKRWKCSIKSVDRLRELPKNHPKYLKSTEITKNLIRFRLKDIVAHERRNTHNMALLFSNFSDDDMEDLDPAAGSGKKLNYP